MNPYLFISLWIAGLVAGAWLYVFLSQAVAPWLYWHRESKRRTAEWAAMTPRQRNDERLIQRLKWTQRGVITDELRAQAMEWGWLEPE